MMKPLSIGVHALLIAIFALLAGCGNNAEKSESAKEVASAAPASAAPANQAASPAVQNGFDGMPAPGTQAVCPVMGDKFAVKPDSPKSEYKGKTYVFCCPGCKPKFDENPEKFI